MLNIILSLCRIIPKISLKLVLHALYIIPFLSTEGHLSGDSEEEDTVTLQQEDMDFVKPK